MQGAIIDTACAIATESRDQSIDMGTIPFADFIRNGQGRAKYFSIKLINCFIEQQSNIKRSWNKFQVTFDGDADGRMFEVQGKASGISLQIISNSGKVVVPGRSLPLEQINAADMKLNYKLRLVANQKKLKAGHFFSAIRFKLDYF
ncbi:fimbrial protein [Enterobacter bugandensis]|uniref:fimbrial protein n=1 Tax=Enterobacter bugandensis TaxID=881260 RepID=UPI001EF94978|nr:fimbrial protein [Enterobacter bugandensis]